jgi:hypothetical protein
MLHDAVEDPASRSPAELRAAYAARLRETVEAVGVEEAATASGVDETTVAALAAGESPELTVEEAAALLAAGGDGVDDADVILAELRDHLLLGMTTGVLDVDTVASNVDLDLSGQEIQQVLEGRVPMTLAELAAIQQFIAERNER